MIFFIYKLSKRILKEGNKSEKRDEIIITQLVPKTNIQLPQSKGYLGIIYSKGWEYFGQPTKTLYTCACI